MLCFIEMWCWKIIFRWDVQKGADCARILCLRNINTKQVVFTAMEVPFNRIGAIYVFANVEIFVVQHIPTIDDLAIYHIF